MSEITTTMGYTGTLLVEPNLAKLDGEITGLDPSILGISNNGTNPLLVNIITNIEPSIELIANIDMVLTAHDPIDIEAERSVAYAIITDHYSVVLQRGLLHGGITLSCSEPAQFRFMAVNNRANALNYPYYIPSIDNSGVLVLYNAGEMNVMYDSLFVHCESVFTAFQTFLGGLKAAQTVNDINNITNSYLGT